VPGRGIEPPRGVTPTASQTVAATSYATPARCPELGAGHTPINTTARCKTSGPRQVGGGGIEPPCAFAPTGLNGCCLPKFQHPPNGASGGDRTHTTFRSLVFETSANTCSATLAYLWTRWGSNPRCQLQGLVPSPTWLRVASCPGRVRSCNLLLQRQAHFQLCYRTPVGGSWVAGELNPEPPD
jgi:hypothetical protein